MEFYITRFLFVSQVKMVNLSEEAQEILRDFGGAVAEEISALACAGAEMAVAAGPEAFERIMVVGECPSVPIIALPVIDFSKILCLGPSPNITCVKASRGQFH